MASKELIRAVESYEDWYKEHGKVEDVLIEYYMDACQVAYCGATNEKDIPYGKKLSKRVKELIDEAIRYDDDCEDFYELESLCNLRKANNKHVDLYYETLKWEAPHLFHSFMLYIEKNRPEEERFYSPRAQQLQKLGIIDAMQSLDDDEIDILSISMPPGTGKTGALEFFSAWNALKYINDYSLFFSHSAEITNVYYRAVLNITTNEDYLVADVFPNFKLESTNAKAETINFGKYKPFANIQCTSVGSKNAGKVRANRYLYCDDLIGGIEEAVNKAQLDKLWRIYTSDARQRKLNQNVKEIHIATRWSVHDVIGRLQSTYADSKRARFIAVPDIDPKTGESNFNYRINGMSVEHFNDIALTMDDVTYRCLYKNEPIEREGLLYQEDDIRRYATLPEREPDAILGVCDTKTTGKDYMFLPVFYQYDNDFYLADCICDDSADFNVQYERITNIILDHKMQQCEFEANAGGSRIAFEISNRVKDRGGRCNITEKATETNKETRIIVNSDWIKKHILFRMKDDYEAKTDYGKMMSFLMSYTVAGKNKFDDVVDGLANFALYVTKKTVHSKARIIKSPI